MQRANGPAIRAAYKTAVNYLEKQSAGLTTEQIESGNELKRRLRRLESDFNRLININGILLAEVPDFHFDESTDTLTVIAKGGTQSIRLKRADPNVPIRIAGSTKGGGYVAGASSKDETAPTEILKKEMEQLLEQYYDNAFRITKLAQFITGRKKYHCLEITMVRNKLIRHPPNGSIYSFGFTSNGPVVKPTYRGERPWTDAGLVPNTQALVDSLKKVLS